MKILSIKFFLAFAVTFLALNSSCFAQETLSDRTKTMTIEKIGLLIKQSENLSVQDAKTNLQEALYLANGIGDKFYIANTSAALSKINTILKNYSQAEVDMIRAISNYRDLKNPEHLGLAYLDYAQLFITRQRYNRALEYLNLAQTIFEEQNLPVNKALVLKEKGRVALAQKTNIKAIGFLEEALKYFNKSLDKYPYADALLLNGKAYYDLENYYKSKSNVHSAFEIAQCYNFKEIEAEASLLLSQIYMNNNNIEKAYEYLGISNRLNKELRSDSSQRVTPNEQTRKQLEEKDEVITNLSELNLQQEREIRLNTLITLLSIAFVTILSLLTLSLYKNNKIREKANTLLLQQRDELKIAKENAENATKAKAQFLSTITHELRTPLYAVTGLTNLLMDENPSKAQKQHLNSLKFSGEYLLSLINDILDINKLEANKVELREDIFNLKKQVNDVLVALNHSAKKNKLTVHFHYDQTIPKLLIGDAIKLSQVLINLIGNAIKFTSNGDVWVRIEKMLETEDTCLIKFEIKDNGVGISKEQQEKLFLNFSQASLETSRKYGGTGLGLSIVKQLIELMGSKISVKSSLGKGTTFTFNLSLRIAKDAKNRGATGVSEYHKTLKPRTTPSEYNSATPQKKARSTAVDKLNNAPAKKLKGNHILVVEDNKINQMITRKILEKNGATCEVADNGEKAVAIARELDFNLILMDIRMPGISGIEATKEIRQFNSQVPILALTAMSLEDNGNEFYDSGFTDIIPKPYKEALFFEKITNALKIASSQAQQL